MKSATISSIIFAMTISSACDSGGGDVITTVVTSATVGPDPTSPATTDDTSTSNVAPTEGGDPTTTTGFETTDTSTTGDPDFTCVDEGQFACNQAPVVRGFCAYISDSCAEHEIESTYCSILMQKCENTVACTMCFELSNYCKQIGVACDDLYLECGCVAAALGVE